MNGKMFKTPVIGLLIICCMFFINTNGVKADDTCSCYYYGSYIKSSTTTLSDFVTGYLVEFKYGTNQSDVNYSCMFTKDASTDSDVNGAKKGCTSSSASTNILERGNPFDVASDKIFNKSCKKSKCNTAKIKICESDQYRIVTGDCSDTLTELKAITKEQYEAIKGSDDANATAVEEGVAGDKEDHEKAKTKIINWGQNATNTGGNGEYSNCDIISDDLIDFLHNFFVVIEVVGIILLVILTAIEFVKVITISEEDGLKGAFKNTVRRIIVVVVLLLLPTLITWLLNIINSTQYVENSDGTVYIGENGKPLCK